MYVIEDLGEEMASRGPEGKSQYEYYEEDEEAEESFRVEVELEEGIK